MTRIVQPVNHDVDALQRQISPDGEQAFIVTRKPDVATDVNRFELLWLDLSPQRLARGGVVSPVAVLTIDARLDEDDYNPPLREARWLDDRTLVFRARLNEQPFQVYRFDLPTRKLTQLTYAPLGLSTFDVTSDLRRVVYVAPVPNPAVSPGARSVVVGTHSFWNVHFGHEGFRNQQRRYQYFVAEARSRLPARALGESFPEGSQGYPTASISPDGRWAVLPRYEPMRQLDWARQYPLIAEATATYAASQRLDPLGYFSRPQAYVARRMALFRLEDAQEQTIVDAPDDSYQLTQRRNDRLWQDGGRSVVIAGTFLPRRAGDSDAVAVASTVAAASASSTSSAPSASHIIEYWPDTGTWKTIATLNGRLREAFEPSGRPGSFIAVDGDVHRHFNRRADGSWQESPQASWQEVTAASASDGRAGAARVSGPDDEGNPGPGSRWRLEVQEALNQPPDVVAHGPGGAKVRLTDLNPQFSAASWGTMSAYDWKDAKGRTWRGGLMVPADFDPKARHALVIQTYGFSPKRFYRDGSNTYDGFTSGFPGRAFLRERILVLAVPPFPPDAGITSHRDKMIAIQDGVRTAIDDLVGAGLVDRNKVGIMGWSSTGEQVLNLVTFADVPIRAASMLDGDANTLFSMAITYSVLDGIQLRKEEANGGGPYGANLQRWIENDPSLHTDCIRAALRIETYGPEVHNHWDIYPLLRRQYKPAEMVFIPGGAHALSRPSERMISLQGNVDWYGFWLNGAKRSEVLIPGETAVSLTDQYRRWDQMLELKRADDVKPACVKTARAD